MDIKKNLYSKTGAVLEGLAAELLLVEQNDRIPKIQDLSTKFGVGRGTIQAALKKLEETKCIRLESKGHLGTFLRQKNGANLLRLAGIERLFGVMPLPYSKKYEGLATAFHEEIQQLDLPLSIAFMSGADKRLDEVANKRYDFALVPKFSACEYVKENPALEVLLNFGPATYLTKHVFITAQPKETIKKPMKIGIDSVSIDQRVLTLAEFNHQEVEFVELNYMHVAQYLLTGEIDGAIWNADEFVNKQNYHTYPLSPQSTAFSQQINEAVCVIRTDNVLTRFLLQKLSISGMLAIQQQVESGSVSPKY